MLVTSFNPFPTLETDRLLLRQMTMDDDEDLFALRSDTMVNQFIKQAPPESIEEMQHFIEINNKGIRNNEFLFWIIEGKIDKKFIGTICLWNLVAERDKVEIGYDMLPEYGRQGYMHEAMAAVVQYARDVMMAKRIEAFTHPDNERSIKLLEKFDFKRDKEEEERLSEQRGWNVIYAFVGLFSEALT